MTIKQLTSLLDKLKDNNQELFESVEIDVEWLFDIIKGYAYDDLGDIIIEALDIIKDNTEEDFYDIVDLLCFGNGEQSDSYISEDKSIITTYFKDIKEIYNKYGNKFDINYAEDDREKVICMNMKTVITIAKRYQGLGLSLSELISAGNVGLVEAYSSFDPTRNTVKSNMMEAISVLPDKFSWEDLYNCTKTVLSYGTLYEKYYKKFSKKNSITKEEITTWIDKYVKPAKFNSVAAQRITAAIKTELTNYSSVIKQSKQSDSYIKDLEKDKQTLEEELKTASINEQELLFQELDLVNNQLDYAKSSLTLPKITRIDAPVDTQNINQGGNMDLENVITAYDTEDDSVSEYDRISNRKQFNTIIEQLIGNCKERNKKIFYKSFGIGYPDKMSIQEIAAQEDMSVARVSQIINEILENVQYNVKKYKISKDDLYELLN